MINGIIFIKLLNNQYKKECSELSEDDKRLYQRNLTKNCRWNIQKKLRYREDILDNMGSEELVDNLFRIVKTEAKLKRKNIKGESKANKTYFIVVKKVRNTIKELGGTIPEELPTPKKSLKGLEKEKNKIK